MPNTTRIRCAATDTNADDGNGSSAATIEFTADQTAQLLALLGLPADDPSVDADTILATITDLVSAEAGDDPSGSDKPSQVAAAAARIGLTLIDADTVAKLKADADEGRQIKAAAARRDIETKVDAAIGRGAITPARREHWLTLLAADPGMADVLASTPDNTAGHLTETGHGLASKDEANGDSGTTPAWFR